MRKILVSLAGLAACSFSCAALAQDIDGEISQPISRTPFFAMPLGVQPVTLPDGRVVPFETQEIWKPACYNARGSMTAQDLSVMSQTHRAAFTDPTKVIVVDSMGPRAGIDIVYVLGAGVPAAAIPAFAAAEAYIEAQFSDPITVTVTVSFANLGPGVLGGTSSASGYLTYADTRSIVVGGKDLNDTIQDSLPAGATCPVRYNGRKATVTNEDRVFTNFANFKANGGVVAGNDANMQYSNTFPFDYDPSNGVSGSAYSFQDVIIHETGHALGFTSGVDFRTADMEVLDLFRFQRSDGSGSSDYNPDTLAEFQTKARLVSYNSPGTDDVNCEIVSVEYRMSDGSPQQASHFFDQSPPIGIMDPTLGYGQTFYPNFFRASDLTMFDAIGYDR